nr:hypothetical protein [Bacilli bacterium]
MINLEFLTPNLDKVKKASKIEKKKDDKKDQDLSKKKDDEKGFQEIFDKETEKYKSNDEKSK